MRYRIVMDDDGHWYVIPADREREFTEWLESGLVDEAPDFVIGIGGSPSEVTFTSPRIFGEPI